MSTDIQVLQRFFAALNRNDIDAAVTELHPKVQRIEPAGFPAAGTYSGIEAVRGLLAAGRGSWAEGFCQPEDFLLKGGKVVVYLHALVRLKGSTEWIDARFADGFVLEEGKILHYESFSQRAEALQWAGIEAEG